MKAVILAGGMGTRLLPLSQVVPKQYLPLGLQPTFKYLVDEAKQAGVEEIIFVNAPGLKKMEDYFSPSENLKERLQKQDKTSLLEELEQLEQIAEEIEISSVVQGKPLGNGEAVYQTKDLVGEEPFAVLFIDDIIRSKTPALKQLKKTFKTSQKPVVGLKQISTEQIPHYGIVATEKIARRLYKVKNIVEKPSPEEAPSDLAVVGRFILTPEIFDYLEQADFNRAQEKTIAAGLEQMRNSGKAVYGTRLKGKWLDCGNELRYLKSNLYQIVNHPRYENQIKSYLNEIM